MLAHITQKIKSAPKNPGIYIFYKNQTPLYVGKASNLRNRLQNYLKITDNKTEALHREANSLKILKLSSNIEALITESKFIKELKPQYNILWRDDKNYFYVEITKEQFPRIFITHQPLHQRITNPIRINEFVNSKQIRNSLIDYIGPFTDGNSLKTILRLLRKFFPYCTCKPHLRLCLNAQINNCPGYCCQRDANILIYANDANVKKYKKNIIKIKNVLTGKDRKFIRQLKDPYELLVLEKIRQHEPYLNQRITNPIRINEFVNSKQIRYSLMETLTRVECYDNSHLSGKEAVGAMTAWKKEGGIWVADKNSWRKFRMRMPNPLTGGSMRKAHANNYFQNDPAMIEQIITRRLNHPEWPYPDLIIIDGGITQFNAAMRALNQRITNPIRINEFVNSKQIRYSLMKLKIISFAKPQQLVFGLEKHPVPISALPPDFQNIIKIAIQNTHNFVIRYHRKIREKIIK